MFERRLKILLGLLALITLLLILRAGQVQIVQSAEWTAEAEETMKRTQLLDTVRGKILDRNGLDIALDTACVDACVDYRAMTDPPEPKWLAAQSAARLKIRLGEGYTGKPAAERQKMIKAESEAVKNDIKRMWNDFAQMSGKPMAEITEAREAIIKKVQMRQRLVKMANYERAMAKEKEREEAEVFWRRWLVEGLAGEDDGLEKYAVVVTDQQESHAILRAVPVDIQNYLGKYRDRYPGLELKTSTHRTYPYGHAGCHLLGRVSRVNNDDLKGSNKDEDETRRYLPNDLIGRGGLEALFEKALRGTKGKVVRVPGKDVELSRVDPQPGKDVKTTIDILLQSRIESIFPATRVHDAAGNSADLLLHGAAVIIDVPTGEVLAMASYPTYDLNAFDELYQKLHADEINSPLLNRATMAQLQPGSTIKPAVGLSAIAAGVVGVEQGIECTGYLVIDGKKMGKGRCWVASKFANDPRVATVAHHQIPPHAPHPTGFLTFADALERSCNPYFETLADRLGMEGLSQWYERFGFGRITGLGIPEARGRLPRSALTYGLADVRHKTWYSGIGQDPVSATPIQMANMVSTIARGGMAMRPRLIAAEEAKRFGITLPALKAAPRMADENGQPVQLPDWPEVYDLHLDQSAVKAAHDGMQRVVYGRAGTGKAVVRDTDALEGIRICGKTGTAQAPRFTIKLRDPATGEYLKDAKGRPQYGFLEPGTLENPNPVAPWYRGSGADGRDLAHAWYIGFAPAEKPQIAFAVMVEYGGSGGLAAASVAREVLVQCAESGYLKRGPQEPRAEVTQPTELLRDAAVR